MYSENSIFMRLLNLATSHQTGLVVLRAAVEPLWGDADKIADFYADAEASTTDPEWTGFDTLQAIKDAIENSGLILPPYPGTGDDPLAMTPDGKFYLDPAAANAHFAALMAQSQGQDDALSLVGGEVIPQATNQEQSPITTDQISVLTTDQIESLTDEQLDALTR